MEFKIGDQVVHPHYGLGQVVKLEVRQFEPGVSRQYYEVSIPGSTLWVPLGQPTSGLRKLALKSTLADCRRLLASAPAPLTEDPRMRQSELSAHLKQGTIAAHCEVVRDLSAAGWHKPLSGPIASFLRVTLDVLCQEWAAVEGLSPAEAARDIDACLAKGRKSHDK